jgi:hypothetical protein
MRIGTSIVVMAIGAIMAFAVEVDRAEGFNINTAGIILLIVGAVGLLASIALAAPRRRTVVEDRVVDDRVVERRPTASRTVYHDAV